jgi:hypothetical protein
MMDAGRQIVAAEGVGSLFKGAGANILRGVAGAGVLSCVLYLLFGGRRSTSYEASTIWPRASSPTRPARVSYGLLSSLPR